MLKTANCVKYKEHTDLNQNPNQMKNTSATLEMTATIDVANNTITNDNGAELNIDSILLTQANMEDGEYEIQVILKKK